MEHIKNTNRIKNYIVLLLMVALLVSMLSGCTSDSAKGDKLTRLDNEGYLYYMDYTKDYYSDEVMDKMGRLASSIRVALCSIPITMMEME